MHEEEQASQRVVITDVNMPFSSMVVFLVKLALASIPALMIVWVVLVVFMMAFMALFGSVMGLHELFRQPLQ